jgi:hypothetical protein
MYIIREQRALFETRWQQEIARANQGQNTASGGGENGARDSDDGAQRNNTNNDNEEPSIHPPTSLALRIKKYKRPSPTRVQAGGQDETKDDEDDSSSDVEGEDRCTICFLSLEDGDRVGSLKCNHLFHSECLKLWLQRRNACPLCQTQDIAEPQYEESDTETAASQGDSQVDQAHSAETALAVMDHNVSIFRQS